MLNFDILQSKSTKWLSNLNFTISHNKLLSFPNLSSYPNYANTLIVGAPITINKVYNFAGVNQETGVFEFRDNKGDLNIHSQLINRQTQTVNTTPTFTAGWQNSFNYKNFELDILIQAVKQLGFNYKIINLIGVNNTNQPSSVLNRWQKPGDITDIQKASSALYSPYSNYIQSNAGYTDASFIRLKNVSLSYSLPQNIIYKAGIDQARIFLLGQNIYTLTPYKGLDPEFGTASILPPLRVITVGIQIIL